MVAATMGKGRKADKPADNPDDDMPVPPELADAPDDYEMSSLRCYKRTARKLNELKALRRAKSLHELLDQLLNDTLDHEILAELEKRAAHLRPNNHGKK